MPTVVCHHCSEIFTVDGPKPDQCPSCGGTLHIEGDPTPTGPALQSTIIQLAERKPTTFGRYVVQSRLGAGGFGSVFLAKDPQLARLVAIKVPRGETGRSPLGLERFAREGRNIAQLRHPGIVSVFNVELDGELPFIVCEYVEGETLSDHMRKAPLSFREAAQLIADVAAAVDYAHEYGIIHRDIKPSNIMIDSDGKPRLMDFGLAKREAIDNTVTSDHAILGTPAYMSPEQAWGGKRGAVDRRSDIYSLGTVFYQLLTRELPFHGEPRMVLRQVIEDDPKSPRTLNADVPRDLETICEKAMQKEPASRYQTAGALADDLNRWLRGEPIEARPVTRLERSVRWCRRNPITSGLVATIAGLLVIGFCSATVMFAKERRSRMTLEQALLENNRLLSKAYVEHANRYMDPGGPMDEYSPLQGLPWLSAAQQIDENDPARRDVGRLRLATALRSLPSVEKVWLHPGAISVLAASAKDDWLFTGGTDGTGRLWKNSENTSRGRTLAHPAAITAAQFSPDGKLLLTGCADGAARLWNTANQEPLDGPLIDSKVATAPGRVSGINAICFSGDGLLFATCRQTAVQTWEAATRRPVGRPLLLTAAPSSLQFADANRMLAASCSDGSIVVWDARTGKETFRLQVTPRSGAAIAVSPDGTTLAGTLSPETVAMWKCETGKKLEFPSFFHGAPVKEIRFSPDGRLLATATGDGTASMWKADDGRLIWKRRVTMGVLKEIRFSLRGDRLAVETANEFLLNRRISVLDPRTGSRTAEPIELPRYMRWDFCVGRSDALATGSDDGTVRLWRTESRETTFALPHTSEVCCAALIDERRLLATVDEQGICCLVRQASEGRPSPAEVQSFPTNVTQPVAVALTGPGQAVAVADAASNVSVFDSTSKQLVTRLELGAPISTMAFISDGRHLITVSTKGDISAWDKATGERIRHEQLGLSGKIGAASIRGGLCCIAVGNQICVRDALNPGWSGVLLPHDQPIGSCCFSPDGELLLSACKDRVARVWAIRPGKLLAATPRLPSSILCAAFSPDGTRFATGCDDDGAVRIWQTADALPATGTFSHGSPVTGLNFSPDGRYLITTRRERRSSGFEEPIVRLWNASNGDIICTRTLSRLSARFPSPSEWEADSWRPVASYFSPDGKISHVVTTGGVIASVDLRAATHVGRDFQLEVGVRSGMHVDATGGLLFIEPEKIRMMSQSLTSSP